MDGTTLGHCDGMLLGCSVGTIDGPTDGVTEG